MKPISPNQEPSNPLYPKNHSSQMILLFCIMFGNSTYLLCPIYYPYLDSWIKSKDPHFSSSVILFLFNIMDLGIPIFNFIAEKLIPLIGLNFLIMLNGPITLICYTSFYLGYHEGFLILANLFAGFSHQAFIVFLMEILTRRFPKTYLEHNGKINSAMALNTFVWTGLSVWIMNPFNLPASEVAIIDGSPEHYFGTRVSKNFLYLMIGLIANTVVCCTVLGFFVDDPTFEKSALYRCIYGERTIHGVKVGRVKEDGFEGFQRKESFASEKFGRMKSLDAVDLGVLESVLRKRGGTGKHCQSLYQAPGDWFESQIEMRTVSHLFIH